MKERESEERWKVGWRNEEKRFILFFIPLFNSSQAHSKSVMHSLRHTSSLLCCCTQRRFYTYLFSLWTSVVPLSSPYPERFLLLHPPAPQTPAPPPSY